jgi:hypothetical protein
MGQGAGKTPACPCILPFNFERLPVGGKYRFIFGSSPAVTGRDWQEGNNVLLSGNIGKEVFTGNTRSWWSLTRILIKQMKNEVNFRRKCRKFGNGPHRLGKIDVFCQTGLW